ncbi:MAG TPA: ATP-binding protein, partial [Chitinophagaceae bacterium]|nr:ATP-binding protein [Chitinophagaceae bacterium]
ALQREIEERKLSEEKIKMLNARLLENNMHLKEANAELDQFAYLASHDLQEPLRKIMVFSDKILLKQLQDEETGRYFTKITNSARRMQALINDLLSFSRHSVGTSDFKKTDLRLLVNEAIAELEIEIEKSNAHIIVKELPSLTVIPGLMQQLFYNLVSNAIKFRKKSVPPLITIEAEKIVHPIQQRLPSSINGTTYHQIGITDNGIGFDEKYAGEIFMVFKRLHSYHEYEGTGVGLSLCKKIIEKHNGFISASSKPGEGSKFVISLPEVRNS